MQNVPEIDTLLGFGQVFTLLFVTLGPLKLLGPFVNLTHGMAAAAMKKTALLSFLIAVIAVLFGGFLGRALLGNWQVSIPALYLTGGIIFALVGLRLVLEQYEGAPAATPPPVQAPGPLAAAMRVTFPSIVTPYGIAALIIMLANSPDAARTQGVVLLLLVVMALNLAAMLFARSIMRGVVLIGLQILGAVLGVLQVALAIEMILRALRGIGALHG